VITKLNLKQPTAVIGQAEEFVRELIASGELGHGARLPSTAALARSWGIPVASAHAALAELTRDGLLVRQPGKGTFVSSRKPAMTAVALYTLADSLANPESSIQRVILAELQRQLTEDGIHTHAVVDPRNGAALAEPWEPLVRLSSEHRVGATIATCTNQFLLPWLSRLPHMAAFVDDKRIAGRVAQDLKQLTDICLQALAEQGCRSVGLMCGPLDAFYAHFTSASGKLGLRVKDDWISWPVEPAIMAGQFHACGYRRFRDLWRQPDRPDGLMIYPDSFVPGVLLAMAELRVRAPEHLRLAYHRNEQTPILNPFPATEAILSEREIAAALIAQARRVRKGDSCETVTVGFRREDKS